MSISHVSNLLSETRFERDSSRSFRDEMIEEFVEGINKERASRGWMYEDKKGNLKKLIPITPKLVALRLNKNPFTKGKDNDSEVYFILNECKKNGFQQFFYRT